MAENRNPPSPEIESTSKRDLRTYGLYFLAWTVIGLFFFSEFVTGETTLALHPASPMNPAGAVELGFAVAGIQTFHKEMFAPEPISARTRQSSLSG